MFPACFWGNENRILPAPMGKSWLAAIAASRNTPRGRTEKREHPRLSLRLPTEYSPEGSEGFRNGYTLDMAEGGLLLNVMQELSPGQRVRIRIYYHTTSGIETIQALAEVCRVNRSEIPAKGSTCALRFVGLPAAELKKIQDIIRALS